MATRRAPRVPGYRLHKPSGQAVVTLAGRDHYLGPHGSDASHAKYQRLAAEYVRNGFRAAVVQVGEPYTVALLCDDFLSWAEREYRRGDGQPTGAVENVRLALRTLFQLFADVAAEDFGPKSLVLYQESLAGRGLSRSTTNDRTRIVRQAFKWAVREQKISPMVHHGLSTVRGIRRGRAGVKETEPVRPVPEAHVEAALPKMPEPVAAMVRLQLLSGARPGEMVILRPCDIDMSGKVWFYRPVLHENSWRGKSARSALAHERRRSCARSCGRVTRSASCSRPHWPSCAGASGCAHSVGRRSTRVTFACWSASGARHPSVTRATATTCTPTTARSSERAGRRRCLTGRPVAFATTRPRASARSTASRPPRPSSATVWSRPRVAARTVVRRAQEHRLVRASAAQGCTRRAQRFQHLSHDRQTT